MIKTIEWKHNKVIMVDQRLLPGEEIYREYSTFEEVAGSIEDMVIRGAPAIGVAAAMGIALGMLSVESDAENHFDAICQRMARTRPTAVNLFWAIQRMKQRYSEIRGLPCRNSSGAGAGSSKFMWKILKRTSKWVSTG
jgi:methylthioribose-1-phosphate isomerase